MAPVDQAKWAPKAKKAAKASLDLCKGLTDTTGPAFDAVGSLDEALGQDQDPVDLLKLALTALETTAKSAKASTKADSIRRKVQPLSWACKDLAKLFKDVDDLASFGACHLVLAHLAKCNLEDLNAPNQMLKAAQEAIKVFRDSGDVAGQASACQSMVDAHLIKAQLSPFKEVQAEEASQALEHAQSQLKLYKSIGDLKGESQALNNLAQVYMNSAREGGKDELLKADEAAESSFRLAKKLGEQDLEVATFRTFLNTRLQTEGATEVERLCDEASRRWKRGSPGERQYDQAWVAKTAADALLHMGEVGEGLEKAREALSLYEKIGDGAGQADALMTVYGCLDAKGESVEAKETLNEAIEMFRQVGDKRSEGRACLQAVEPMIRDLKIDVLADCFFSRDLQDPNYNIPDADLYRRGDEAMRMAKRAVALFAEVGEQNGQLAVDQVIQDTIEKAVKAHVKSNKPMHEKLITGYEKDRRNETTRVGVWLVQLPRMLSVATTDEERAQGILRLERDPPARKAKKKVAREAESSSEEEDDADVPAAITQSASPDAGAGKLAVYKGPTLDDIVDVVKGAALDLIGSDELTAEEPLMDAGMDSLAAVEYQGILNKQYIGVTLPGTLMFDFPNVAAIAGMIDGEMRAAAGFA